MLSYCVEKLHRAPEECPGIRMDTFWELIVLEEEAAERNERMKPGKGKGKK